MYVSFQLCSNFRFIDKKDSTVCTCRIVECVLHWIHRYWKENCHFHLFSFFFFFPLNCKNVWVDGFYVICFIVRIYQVIFVFFFFIISIGIWIYKFLLHFKPMMKWFTNDFINSIRWKELKINPIILHWSRQVRFAAIKKERNPDANCELWKSFYVSW